MRLRWNSASSCFESEFQDFQNDLAAVKSAGFKTSGPPDWIWYTNKIAALEKLRKNRPASGLTILEDALIEYNRQKVEDDKRIALLAELKARKKEKPKQIEIVDPDFVSYGKNIEDKQIHVGYIPPVWTGPNCHVCNGPVYFYETQNPPTCLWCEIQLDNQPEMF